MLYQLFTGITFFLAEVFAPVYQAFTESLKPLALYLSDGRSPLNAHMNANTFTNSPLMINNLPSVKTSRKALRKARKASTTINSTAVNSSIINSTTNTPSVFVHPRTTPLYEPMVLDTCSAIFPGSTALATLPSATPQVYSNTDGDIIHTLTLGLLAILIVFLFKMVASPLCRLVKRSAATPMSYLSLTTKLVTYGYFLYYNYGGVANLHQMPDFTVSSIANYVPHLIACLGIIYIDLKWDSICSGLPKFIRNEPAPATTCEKTWVQLEPYPPSTYAAELDSTLPQLDQAPVTAKETESIMYTNREIGSAAVTVLSVLPSDSNSSSSTLSTSTASSETEQELPTSEQVSNTTEVSIEETSTTPELPATPVQAATPELSPAPELPPALELPPPLELPTTAEQPSTVPSTTEQAVTTELVPSIEPTVLETTESTPSAIPSSTELPQEVSEHETSRSISDTNRELDVLTAADVKAQFNDSTLSDSTTRASSNPVVIPAPALAVRTPPSNNSTIATFSGHEAMLKKCLDVLQDFNDDLTGLHKHVVNAENHKLIEKQEQRFLRTLTAMMKAAQKPDGSSDWEPPSEAQVATATAFISSLREQYKFAGMQRKQQSAEFAMEIKQQIDFHNKMYSYLFVGEIVSTLSLRELSSTWYELSEGNTVKPDLHRRWMRRLQRENDSCIPVINRRAMYLNHLDEDFFGYLEVLAKQPGRL